MELEECFFYHSIDLPVSGPQAGVWDLRGRFDDYVGHQDLQGRTVLDVGTASGFLTFEAETRGATVTSFEVASVEQLHVLPYQDSLAIQATDATLERLKNAYRLAHDELSSSASCVYGDIYSLSPDTTELFDVVLIGQLLVHLPDAISALAAASSVCRDTLIIVEGSFEDPSPVAGLCARADQPSINYAWYHYSTGWYNEVLRIIGFRDISIDRSTYRCNAQDHESEIELTTFIAHR
jgi:SAM-dependent methyltransferase